MSTPRTPFAERTSMRVMALVAACVLGPAAALADRPQPRTETAEAPCSEVFRRSLWHAAAVAGPGLNDVDAQIRRAIAQFRFHRRADALATLRALEARLHGDYGRRMRDAKRIALVASLRDLGGCAARSEPRPLATVTVRVFVGTTGTQDSPGPPAGQGVLLLVDDIIAGRTRSDGTRTLRVPSGPIHIRAEVHGDHGARGEAAVDLAPGASGETAIALGEGGHPAYRTELVLLEAVHETLPLSSPRFTLQFRENGAAVRIDRVVEAALLDADLEEQELLTDDFRAADGLIVARHARELLAKLPKDSWMYLSVIGRDTTGVHRHNVVRLRVTEPRVPPARNGLGIVSSRLPR